MARMQDASDLPKKRKRQDQSKHNAAPPLLQSPDQPPALEKHATKRKKRDAAAAFSATPMETAPDEAPHFSLAFSAADGQTEVIEPAVRKASARKKKVSAEERAVAEKPVPTKPEHNANRATEKKQQTSSRHTLTDTNVAPESVAEPPAGDVENSSAKSKAGRSRKKARNASGSVTAVLSQDSAPLVRQKPSQGAAKAPKAAPTSEPASDTSTTAQESSPGIDKPPTVRKRKLPETIIEPVERKATKRKASDGDDATVPSKKRKSHHPGGEEAGLAVKDQKDDNEASVMAQTAAPSKKARKNAKVAAEPAALVDSTEPQHALTTSSSSKKKKKPDRESQSSTKSATKPQQETAAPEPAQAPDEPSPDTGDQETNHGRHIVFVGNLPFSATEQSIRDHFSSLAPISVRCLSGMAKAGSTAASCRGVAFVEFPDARSQCVCLDRFHHSDFDDGISPVRKINVELTAGGGGRAAERMAKIKAKNEKLGARRVRRVQKEQEAKDEKKKTEAAAGAAGATARPPEARDDVHPGRKQMISKTGKQPGR